MSRRHLLQGQPSPFLLEALEQRDAPTALEETGPLEEYQLKPAKLPAGVPGKLHRLDSTKGGGMTAIYVPDAARGVHPVKLLVYIHGNIRNASGLICGAGDNAFLYLANPKFPLPSIVAQKAPSFVLVVPSMNWGASDWHTLASPKAMNAFLDEVCGNLVGEGWATKPAVERLILAGHSRAYVVLNALADKVTDAASTSGAMDKLSDVWSLDTTYGRDFGPCQKWIKWASTWPGVDFVIAYRRLTGTAAEALCIREEAELAGLKNFTFERFDPKALGHCEMPADRLPHLLAKASKP